MHPVRTVLILCFLKSLVPHLLAENSLGRVAEIEWIGLKRTKLFVVQRELTFKEGDAIDKVDIEKSKQNLYNVRLFSDIQIDSIFTSESRIKIQIRLQERWTTIPIAKLSSGGGVRQYIVGLYDINWFGRLLELGGQYERLNNTDSGILWYRDPRFLDERNEVFVSLWSICRNRIIYDDKGRSQDIIGGYSKERKRVAASYRKQIGEHWFGLIGMRQEFDQFILRDATEEVKSKQDPDALPSPSTVRVLTTQIEFDKLNYTGHLIRGPYFSFTEESARVNLGSSSDIENSQIEFMHFALPFSRLNTAFRVLAGVTRTDLFEHQKFIGGFEGVRGFFAERFTGTHYLLTNSELRMDVYRSGSVVMQTNAFVDLAAIDRNIEDLDQLDAGSWGLGVRLLSPKIYRFVARLDLAFAFQGGSDSPLSFGVQQFF